METPCLRPSEGHKHGGRKVTETHLSLSFAIEMQNYMYALELRDIERNVSSSASTVQLAKTKVIIHLFDLCDSLLGSQFSCHAMQKLGNSNMLYYNKNPVELKHCETPSSYRVFYLIKLKPQKER